MRGDLKTTKSYFLSKEHFDYLVYIGRFAPSHIPHVETIFRGLDISEKIIIIRGSAYQPRTPKNPWTVDESWEMLRLAISERAKELGIDVEGRII